MYEERNLASACQRLMNCWIWHKWFKTQAYREAKRWVLLTIVDARQAYCEKKPSESHCASLYRKIKFAENLIR